MKFEYWDWDDIAAFIFAAFVCLFIIIGIIAAVADHHVKYYYMDGSCNGTPSIKGDIDWASDITINVPANISFSEAIELMDKMNKSLPK